MKNIVSALILSSIFGTLAHASLSGSYVAINDCFNGITAGSTVQVSADGDLSLKTDKYAWSFKSGYHSHTDNFEEIETNGGYIDENTFSHSEKRTSSAGKEKNDTFILFKKTQTGMIMQKTNFSPTIVICEFTTKAIE